MPVMMVGAAAGRITGNALRSGPTSSVRATLSHSRLTPATPNAVLISIGHSEQMKMTKIAPRSRVLDREERERHPGERRDRLQHLDERIERAVHQRRHADQEADRHRDQRGQQVAVSTRAIEYGKLDADALVVGALVVERVAGRAPRACAPTSAGPGRPTCPGRARRPRAWRTRIQLPARAAVRPGAATARAAAKQRRTAASDEQRRRRTASAGMLRRSLDREARRGTLRASPGRTPCP